MIAVLRSFLSWVGGFVGMLDSVEVVSGVSLFQIFISAVVLSMFAAAFWRGVRG